MKSQHTKLIECSKSKHKRRVPITQEIPILRNRKTKPKQKQNKLRQKTLDFKEPGKNWAQIQWKKENNKIKV